MPAYQRAVAVIAALLSLTGAAWSAGPQGVFEVCRRPELVTLFDRQPIYFAAGTTFADIADERDRSPDGNSYRPVRVALLDPVTIPVGTRCASARAMVTMNPGGFRIGPDQHRVYRFSGSFSGPMPEVNGLTQTEFR